jgi:hypothetical protein
VGNLYGRIAFSTHESCGLATAAVIPTSLDIPICSEPSIRDRLSSELGGVLCFEMEEADLSYISSLG